MAEMPGTEIQEKLDPVARRLLVTNVIDTDWFAQLSPLQPHEVGMTIVCLEDRWVPGAQALVFIGMTAGCELVKQAQGRFLDMMGQHSASLKDIAHRAPALLRNFIMAKKRDPAFYAVRELLQLRMESVRLAVNTAKADIKSDESKTEENKRMMISTISRIDSAYTMIDSADAIVDSANAILDSANSMTDLAGITFDLVHESINWANSSIELANEWLDMGNELVDSISVVDRQLQMAIKDSERRIASDERYLLCLTKITEACDAVVNKDEQQVPEFWDAAQKLATFCDGL